MATDRVLTEELGLTGGGLESSSRAATVFLKIKGQKQGEIKGGCTIKGHEGRIQILGYAQDLESPRDVATGLPTGRRIHKPIGVAFKLDKSVPLLYNVLINNENIQEWLLEYYAQSHKGSQTTGAGQGTVLTYTVKLTNANLSSLRQITHESGMQIYIAEFTYQKVEWTWVDGGIAAQDDWEAPTV